MKQMKKLFALLLVLCMVFSLCACGGNNETEDTDGENIQTEKDETDVMTDNDEEEVVEEETASFQVHVVDESGNPISGVMIQICKDTCIPCMTDGEGVAVFNIEIEDGHKLSVTSCPEGYEYTGEAEVYLESGITEYTVELKEVN